jgi:predicted nucleic acid-binding protein
VPSFVDTSALLKLYVPERGATWMVQTVRPSGIAISALAITETGVSLARLVHNHLLLEAEARDAWKLFRRELREFLVYRLDRAALIGAAQIASRLLTPVRALDAIHLRGAQEAAADARRVGQSPPVFVSADQRLLAAAAALGFATDNPHNHV